MDPLVARIRRTLRRFSLIPAGSRVLVAVSGGADSMALLFALRDLEGLSEVDVAGIAHLNHGLRGNAADDDEAFCRDVAAQLGVAFDTERVDVRGVAAERRLSIEAAGHAARYEFFERAAARLGADRVALGHTRDDQAETFLLRLLRGAGPRGLSSMHPRTGRFIRPMLDCSRRQVRRFVTERAIAFREDASNRDVTIDRNLVRHDVIPHLARRWPGIVRVLGREAEIARDDADFLDATARAAFDRLVRQDADAVSLDARQLRLLPAAVARRVIAMAVLRFSGGRFVGFEHIDRLLDVITDRRPGRGSLSLPGQCVEFDGSSVLLKGRRAPGVVPGLPGAARANFFRFSLSIPGEVVSPLGWTLSAERAIVRNGPWHRLPASSGEERTPYPRSWAVLDGAAVASSLVVRNWTPGDRFRPLGMTGTRKLQDWFVDRKVPRERRGEIPIVVDAGDRIVWVGGHVIAEDFRVTRAAPDVVILKLRYWRHGT